ncbi:MAG: glycosyltransferase [Bacteroidales bacterium]|jgi:glycosyltransferase involved in cell wall biosynthesis|nr:glycosyltransferase [Bacteroidales bacterium]
MKISFLTSGHFPFDDRIYYHLAKSLSANGHKVEIVSSKTTIIDSSEGISINCFEGDNLSKKNKRDLFYERLVQFFPEIIICAEPLPVLAATRYRRKNHTRVNVIYDITEWYPSTKNLSLYQPFFRWIIFVKLFVFNLFASSFVDAFIFGEWYKSRPYRLIFPSKPYAFISYYPDLTYIRSIEPSMIREKLKLIYSGKISKDKGFGNFIKVVTGLSDVHKDLRIDIRVIGWYESDKDQIECEPLFNNTGKNISFSVTGRKNFYDYIDQIKEADIFLDLRKQDFENHHSLPIKLFYYAALGRPVIFTDLKSIRMDVEIEKFGFLVKPDRTDTIIELISGYLQNRELYLEHCRNALTLAEEKYNWQKLNPDFLRFIDSFSPR